MERWNCFDKKTERKQKHQKREDITKRHGVEMKLPNLTHIRT